MSVLKLQVKDRILAGTDVKQIFSGTQNVDSIEVSFDAEWNGFFRTAIFTSNGKDCYFADLDTLGKAVIPAPVLEKAGTVFIGIMGENGNQRITSSLIRYRVGEGASVADLLDPSEVKSLMDLINECLNSSGGITGGRAGATFIPAVSGDGTISWTNNGGLENPASVNIKGPEGIGISTVTAYYARSSSGSTAPTSGYTTSVPTLASTYRYMWGYLRFTLTNGQTLDTSKTVIGVYGNTGSQGTPGISPVLDSSKEGSTTVITVTDANGTRELAQILDGSNTSGGGVSIESITQYFLRSSSAAGVVTTTSGWQTTIPALSSTYYYMWTYLKVNLSDGTSMNSTPMVIGSYNYRLSSVSLYFLRNNSDATPSTTTSGWSTSQMEPDATNRNLWCHLRFSFCAYGTASVHSVYSNVFKLKSYQGDTGAGGVVLDLTDQSNVNDTSQGDAALKAIQAGTMPVIYTNFGYAQVLRAQPISSCGVNYIRLSYLIPSCSSDVTNQVDWKTSA